MLQPVDSPVAINQTNRFAIYNFLNGTYRDIEGLTFPFYHLVDVRDVACAHVLALTNTAASNQRILLVAGLIIPQFVINTVRQNFPELRERVVEGNPNQIYPRGVNSTGWDTRKSFEIFGKEWKYLNLETSVVDTVKCLLKLEQE